MRTSTFLLALLLAVGAGSGPARAVPAARAVHVDGRLGCLGDGCHLWWHGRTFAVSPDRLPAAARLRARQRCDLVRHCPVDLWVRSDGTGGLEAVAVKFH